MACWGLWTLFITRYGRPNCRTKFYFHAQDVSGWTKLLERVAGKCLIIADRALQKGLPLTKPRASSRCRRLSTPLSEDSFVKVAVEGEGERGEAVEPEGVEGLTCAALSWEHTLSSTMDKADQLKGEIYLSPPTTRKKKRASSSGWLAVCDLYVAVRHVAVPLSSHLVGWSVIIINIGHRRPNGWIFLGGFEGGMIGFDSLLLCYMSTVNECVCDLIVDSLPAMSNKMACRHIPRKHS